MEGNISLRLGEGQAPRGSGCVLRIPGPGCTPGDSQAQTDPETLPHMGACLDGHLLCLWVPGTQCGCLSSTPRQV